MQTTPAEESGKIVGGKVVRICPLSKTFFRTTFQAENQRIERLTIGVASRYVTCQIKRANWNVLYTVIWFNVLTFYLPCSRTRGLHPPKAASQGRLSEPADWTSTPHQPTRGTGMFPTDQVAEVEFQGIRRQWNEKASS